MGFAEILTLIAGLLQFPGALLKLIRALQGTPEAQREKLIAEVTKTIDAFVATGRPSWD